MREGVATEVGPLPAKRGGAEQQYLTRRMNISGKVKMRYAKPLTELPGPLTESPENLNKPTVGGNAGTTSQYDNNRQSAHNT